MIEPGRQARIIELLPAITSQLGQNQSGLSFLNSYITPGQLSLRQGNFSYVNESPGISKSSLFSC